MPNRLLSLVLALGINALAIAVLVAGCGSDDSSNNNASPSSPTSSASSSEPASTAVCAARDKLATDVKSLQNASTLQEFSTDFAAIGVDFKSLTTLAQSAYSDDIAAVQKALTKFGDQLKSLGNGQDTSKNLEDLGKAAGDVNDATQALVTQISCPSS